MLKKTGIAAGIILIELTAIVFCITSCAIHINGTKPVYKSDAWTNLLQKHVGKDGLVDFRIIK